MKIAIKFGDNDFINTFNPLMETLFKAWEYNGSLPNNKEQLLILINSLSFGFYMAFQNNFEYDNLNDGNEYTRNYLQINESKLLLNDEVDSYLESLTPYGGYDNTSTFILDTSLYSNNVYCV